MSEYKDTSKTTKFNKSNLSRLSSEDKLILRDKLKNKKLVTILNHKMFKGYRDIKASKWFVNKKPKYISSLTWENKIFDPFDDLYNLDYKSNVLYPLQNPLFKNFLQIKNYPPTELKRPITSYKNSECRNYIKRKTTGNNTITSSKTINDNNIYITSSSIYKTNNFYKINEPPMKIYNQIFENLEEGELYNNIPILAIEKSKNYYLKKNQLSSKKGKKTKQIIQSDNIYDDEFNGLTETQFLYKISHNKTNKHISDNIKTNSFKHNNGLIRGFSARKIKSAKHSLFNLQQQRPNLGTNGVIIELELDQRGNMTTKRMYTTSHNNKKEEIKVGIKNNNYFIYNFGKNKSKNLSGSMDKSKVSNVGRNKNFDDNFHSEKKKEPKIRIFENKPRFFDDKLMLQVQLDKKNKFLKLKQLMT